MRNRHSKTDLYEVIKSVEKDIYSFSDITDCIREENFFDISQEAGKPLKVLKIKSEDGDYLVAGDAFGGIGELAFIPNPDYLSIVGMKNNLDTFVEDKKAILFSLTGQTEPLSLQDLEDKKITERLLFLASSLLEDILTHQNMDSVKQRYKEIMELEKVYQESN